MHSSRYYELFYFVLVILLLIAAQTLPCFQSCDDIIIGCELKLDATRSDNGKPLSEAIIDF